MDLGNNIYTALLFNPQTITGSTEVTGTSIDRLGYEGSVISCFIGSTYGSPTGVTVTFSLTESEDNSTFTDVSSATAVITNTNTRVEINQDLLGLNRYIRIDAVPGFVGGTAPYVIAGAIGILGGSKTDPV